MNTDNDNGPRRDLTTVLLIVVWLAILLLLMFERWIPHGDLRREDQ
jgi:hypothetical protein